MSAAVDHVDLAGGKGVHLRLRILDDQPLDAVDLGDLPAGEPARRLGARPVPGILQVDDLLPGLPFLPGEDERPRSGRVVDLLVGGRLGHAPRHHERRVARLAKRLQHESVWRLEPDAKALAVDRFHRFRESEQPLAHDVALTPAAERRDDVLALDRAAVVEFETVPQGERPFLAVLAQLVAIDHLRADGSLRVLGKERVVDHVAVHLRDGRRRPDGIDDGEIGVRYDAQDFS